MPNYLPNKSNADLLLLRTMTGCPATLKEIIGPKRLELVYIIARVLDLLALCHTIDLAHLIKTNPW